MATRTPILNADLTCKRTSRGFQNPTGQAWEEVAAETLRTEPITVVGKMPTPVTVWGKTVLAVDEVHNVILAQDDVDAKLYVSSDDGANWTEILVPSTLWAGHSAVAAAGIIGDTCCIVIGDYTINPAADTWRMFRGVWNDIGWTFAATAVLTGRGGSPGPRGVAGAWVAGEYANLTYTANSDTCNVFLSEDDALTWTKIADRFSYAGTTRHIHDVVVDPDDHDTIWVLYGDGAGSMIRKLTRPVAWNGTDLWDHTEGPDFFTEGYCDLTYGHVVDGKIYCTAEYGATWGKILRFDKSWNLDSYMMLPVDVSGIPDHATNNDFGPYIYGAHNSYTYAGSYGENTGGYDQIAEGIVYRNGVWWVITGTRATSETQQQEIGLYCSTDLIHWTCVYRLPPTEGFMRLRGFSNGKMVVNHRDSTAPATSGTTILTLPSVGTVDSAIVEKGYTNSCYPSNAQESDFEGAISFATWYTDTQALYAVTDEGGAVHGTKALRCRSTVANSLSLTWQNNTTRYNLPPNGSLITMSVFAKRVGGSLGDAPYLRSSDTNPSARLIQPKHGGTTAQMDLATTIPADKWFRIMQTYKMVDAAAYATANYRMILRSQITSTPAADLYWDALQISFDADRWRSLSQSWFPTGGAEVAVMANDYSEATLTGLGTDWTVSFDWQPLEGSANFRADFPIFTIKNIDGSDYIEIWWDYSSQRFKLVKSGGETVSDFATVTPFRHYDLIRFCLVATASGTTLYINQPNVGYYSFVSSHVLNTPTTILLGANTAVSNLGCGRYANVNVWDDSLISDQVEDNFLYTEGYEPLSSIEITSPADGSTHYPGDTITVTATTDGISANIVWTHDGRIVGSGASCSFPVVATSLTASITNEYGTNSITISLVLSDRFVLTGTPISAFKMLGRPEYRADSIIVQPAEDITYGDAANQTMVIKAGVITKITVKDLRNLYFKGTGRLRFYK